MKKFVVGILSIVMFLGTILLAGCVEKEISISALTHQVDIYTNNRQADNYLSANVVVELQNSTGNVCASIDSGNSVALASSVIKPNSDGRCTLTINATNEASGYSRIRVYAEEDPTKEDFIDINVYTFLESVSKSQQISDRDLYTVKGRYTELNPNYYLLPYPTFANINKINWGFADQQNSTKLMAGNDVVAEIVDNSKLIAYENCNYGTLNISATFNLVTSVSTILPFAVIEDSNFEEFVFGSQTLIRDSVAEKETTSVSLVRNDSTQSSIGGSITVKLAEGTVYDKDAQTITPRIYVKNSIGEKKILDFKDYFLSYEADTVFNETTRMWTYTYSLDTRDNNDKYTNIYGDFYLEFVFSYSKYSYEFSTSEYTEIFVSTYYIAEELELRDSNYNTIGTDDETDTSGAVELYSSYTTTLGYAVTVNLKLQSSAVIADNTFYISIEDTIAGNMAVDEGYYIVVEKLDGGSSTSPVRFSRVDASNTWISGPINNGSTLFFKSGAVHTASNFKINFIASSNQSARKILFANLYEVNATSVMDIRTETDDPYDFGEIFISSASNSAREDTISLRVYGMSSASGLDVEYVQNQNFKAEITNVVENLTSGYGNDLKNYVLIDITITLLNENFADLFEFYLTHKTGMKSSAFKVNAFVPLTSTTISNLTNGATNVYEEEYQNQGYVRYKNPNGTNPAWYISDGGARYTDTTMSRIMMSAGSSINLNLDFANATLDTSSYAYGYSIGFFDETILRKVYLERIQGDPDKTGVIQDEAAFYEWFYNLSFSTTYQNPYDDIYFLPIYIDELNNQAMSQTGMALGNNYFNYYHDTGMLSLSSFEFVLYAVFYVHGYNEDNQSFGTVRFLRIESFYPVTSVRSNVDSVNLYSTESIYFEDDSLSSTNIVLTLRNDDNNVTYNDPSLFTVTLSSGIKYVIDGTTSTVKSVTLKNEDGEQRTKIGNSYLDLRNISITKRVVSLRIVALSTQQMSNYTESVTVEYAFKGRKSSATISVKIIQADRVEEVVWDNPTVDEEIYVDLSKDDTFIFQATVNPSFARDTGLNFAFSPLGNSSNDVSVRDLTSDGVSSGQNFSISLGGEVGAYGYIYVMPKDMVKDVGNKSVIYYSYDANEEYGISKNAEYLNLDLIDEWYDDLISGTETIANYFLNNSNERVYYRDIFLKIAITFADGANEETAKRIYTQEELDSAVKANDTSYYRVMNDIELVDWDNKGFEFSGHLFGNNDNITLNFSGTSNSLVEANYGEIKNLTLSGSVSGDGFVANRNFGTIQNVKVDVTYDKVNKVYIPSTLVGKTLDNVGAIVGANSGTVSGCYNLGASVSNGLNLGGLVGLNTGIIEDSGVEFYTFADADNNKLTNILTGINNTFIGGLVGKADAGKITNCYVYAFSLENRDNALSIYSPVSRFGAIVGDLAAGSGTVEISKTFAFAGEYAYEFASKGTNIIVKDSYLSFYSASDDSINFRYYNAEGELPAFDDGVGGTIDTTTDLTYDFSSELDRANWIFAGDADFDATANFGFAYLRGIRQTKSVNVNSQKLNAVDRKLMVSDDGTYGIMYYYGVEGELNDIQKGQLKLLNTIAVSDIFTGVEDTRSVLISSSDSNLVEFSTNSLYANGTSIKGNNVKVIKITLYSRVNFADVNEYDIIITYAIPRLVATTISGLELKTGQVLRIQTGLDHQEKVTFGLENGDVYLAGGSFTLSDNNYDFKASVDAADNAYNATEKYLAYNMMSNSVTIIANYSTTSLIPMGLTASVKEINNKAQSEVSLPEDEDEKVYTKFNNLIINNLEREFNISTYNGSSNLYTDVRGILSVNPSETTNFHVYVNSDNINEDLEINFIYKGNRYRAAIKEGTNVVLDKNLGLFVAWKPVYNETPNLYEFVVTLSVSMDYRHKIDDVYSLYLSVASSSIPANFEEIAISVEKQTIDDIVVNSYLIESRVIHSSTWFYTASNSISTTLTPGIDAIMSLEINPNFSHITHFTISNVTTSGGSITLSRVLKNSLYGYYVNSSTTSYDSVTRTLTVRPDSDADLIGGIYYFRMYVSSSFTKTGSVTLTFNFYDESGRVFESTYSYTVDYLKPANILVDGKTSALIAKGGEVSVEIVLEKDQVLNDFGLTNNKSGIQLKNLVETIEGDYKIYTAKVSAGLNAMLQDGSETGEFRVVATVTRVINGMTEYKETSASIYLVDFAIDGKGTKLNQVGGEYTENGKTYDVYYSYLSSSTVLSFDYKFAPENYVYTSDQEAIVRSLTAKRDKFSSEGNYADSESNYYINYTYNVNYGTYEKLETEQRLYYINRDNTYSSIYSKTAGFIENEYVHFSTASGDGITVLGKTQGTVLLRLITSVIFGDAVYSYEYDFAIVVEVYTDEEVPLPIYNAEQFLTYLDSGYIDVNGNSTTKPQNYILMNDIVLDNYTPRATTNFASLDGNGYVIYINSYNKPDETSLNLALFSEVTKDSLMKNVIVNIYNAGQISVNINQYTNAVNIAGFANVNNGIIYNCHVVSFFNGNIPGAVNLAGDNGLVVKFTTGSGFEPVNLDAQNYKVESLNIAGFVNENKGIISNSRVGGKEVAHIVVTENIKNYYVTKLGTFTITGQGLVSGFVYKNESEASIAASYVSNVQINNELKPSTSQTAGFVNTNSGSIQTSYIQGVKPENTTEYYCDLTTIKTSGYLGGFVYFNNGTIKNSYINIGLEIDADRSSLAAGFVYHNGDSGEITLCYSAVKMTNASIDEMGFIGVNSSGTDVLNDNDQIGISYSYYYGERVDVSAQSGYTSGAYSINDVSEQEAFYRFSFVSQSGKLDGIWYLDQNGFITLASANHVAFSHRNINYLNGNTSDYFFTYSTDLQDYNTGKRLNLSYGSLNNPIIIRNAADFAKATGQSQLGYDISSYKQYYNDREVFGNYRFVNDIDLEEILIKTSSSSLGIDTTSLTTTTKTFKGIIDGNGFKIQNIELGESVTCENYGLFANIENGIILSMQLEVKSVHNTSANLVGVLAGYAVDSSIIAVSVSPLEKKDEETAIEAVSIQGNNIVGGLVGAVFGNSKLSDIQIVDIDVQAVYYDSKETSDSLRKAELIRTTLRNHASISTIVSDMSYAGGVVGFVDIYAEADGTFVKYSTGYNITNYDIVTVRVLSSVNVYAEVAGGVFGLIGANTMIYDIGIELDADNNLSNPSYITSINLYAGGIVGESYGGIYASYAQYEKELQTQIEDNMLSGTIAGSGELGQMSIFSYAQADYDNEKTSYVVTRHNNPLYIGGLVGFAGSGFIRDCYNKLNVVSNEVIRNGNNYTNSKTIVVGGIVGYIGSSENDGYYADYIETMPTVTYYIGEVYFSGVLAIKHLEAEMTDEVYKYFVGTERVGSSDIEKGAYAAGLIGGLRNKTTLIMEVANSIPYYDLSLSTEYLDRTFAIVGYVSRTSQRSSRLYVIDENNKIFEVVGGETGYGGQSTIGASVDALKGAYTGTVARDCVANLIKNSIKDSKFIFKIEAVSDLRDRENGYAVMSQYFLENDWNPDVWQHQERELFPNIMLVPQLSIYYLDATDESINDMYRAIKNNPAVTIIVRGRTVVSSPTSAHTDVDLRGKPLITAFYGKMVSYFSYYNLNDEGFIVNESDEVAYGGKKDSKVGLIIDGPIFTNSNYKLLDLNIYFAKGTGYSSNSSQSSILTRGVLSNAKLSDVNIYMRKCEGENGDKIYLHSDIVASKEEANVKNGYAGIIATSMTDVDISNINIIFDKEVELYFVSSGDSSNVLTNLYFGLVTGYSRIESIYSNMVFGEVGLQVLKEESDAPEAKFNLNIHYDIKDSYNEGQELSLYAGLCVGKLEYGGGDTADIDIIVGSLNGNVSGNTNVNIYSSSAGENIVNNLYFGGYFGYAEFDAFNTSQAASYISKATFVHDLIISQKINVDNNAYVGLVAGSLGKLGSETKNGAISIVNSNVEMIQFSGVYSQEPDVYSNTAYIGGIAGYSAASYTQTVDIAVDFTVANANYFSDTDSFTKVFKTNNVKPKGSESLAVSNGKGRAYTYKNQVEAGWLFGQLRAGLEMKSSKASVMTDFEGDMLFASYTDPANSSHDVKNSSVSVGVIGHMTDAVTVKVTATTLNHGNIFVKNYEEDFDKNITQNKDKAASTYIGGFVGVFDDKDNKVSISSVFYDGEIVVSTGNLIFGGIVGVLYVGLEENEISDCAYGGEVRIFVAKHDAVVVGGIVGKIVSGLISINSSVSYGNIFVYYINSEIREPQTMLAKYHFGGILGSYDPEVVSKSATITIGSCSSILTSFNDRVTFKPGDYYANAIAGYGYASIKYTGNYYSSGASLTYQPVKTSYDYKYSADYSFDGDKNYDMAYGVSRDFYGYTTETEKISVYKENNENDIVKKIKLAVTAFAKDYVLPDNEEDRTTMDWKLNPTIVKDSSTTFASGDSNKIMWYAYQNDVTYTSSIKNKLNNIVIVGNGVTLNYTMTTQGLENNPSMTATGNISLFNEFGGAGTEQYAFSAMSGLMFNIDFDVDITLNDDNNIVAPIGNLGDKFSNDNPSSNILYALGSIGDISIGGTKDIYIAGLVAQVYEGLITNCNTDVDIIYRAGNSGTSKVSGLLNFINATKNAVSDVLTCYTVGIIKAYSTADLYAFNSKLSSNGKCRVFDSYTTCELEQVEYGQFNATGKGSLNDFEFDTNEETKLYTGSRVVDFKDSSITLKRNGTKVEAKYVISTNDLSVYYQQKQVEKGDSGISRIINRSVKYSDNSVDSLASWFFSPYRNYGYATTGFGYLRNITVYKQSEPKNEEHSLEFPLVYNTYDYTRLNIRELNKVIEKEADRVTFYFPIINEDYLIAIKNFVSVDYINSKDETNKKQVNNRYILMSNLNMVGGTEWNTCVMASEYNYIDGRDYTITLNDLNTAMFSYFKGEIENLNIVNTGLVNTAVNLGVGAQSNTGVPVIYSAFIGLLEGKLTKVTVEANMKEVNCDSTGKTTVIGGVVGIAKELDSLNDENHDILKSIDSLVNITAKGGNAYIGGIAGIVVSGNVSYSANAGNIILNNTAKLKKLETNQEVYSFKEFSNFNCRRDSETLIFEFAKIEKFEISLIISSYKYDKAVSYFEKDEIEKTNIANAVGGLVGSMVQTNSTSLHHSYNTGAILNNYTNTANGDTEVAMVSGGLVGVAKTEIADSFNQGYVATGNTNNKSYAFSGGIAGYTNTNIDNCANNGKVEAISFTSPVNAYNVSVDMISTGSDGRDEPVIQVTTVYNGGQTRWVYAYAVAYSGNKEAQIKGANEDSDIVVDGNIGQFTVVMQYEFTPQRYSTSGEDYIIDDSFNYRLKNVPGSDNKDFDVDISAYDAYGYPSRINMYYEYTFNFARWGFYDIRNGKASYAYGGDDVSGITSSNKKSGSEGGSGLMEFHINNNNYSFEGGGVRSPQDTDQATLSKFSSMTPGGTSKYYFSMPFYYNAAGNNDFIKSQFTASITSNYVSRSEKGSIDSYGNSFNNTYEQFISAVCGQTANIDIVDGDSVTNSRTMYNNIVACKENAKSENETIDINGKKYNLIENASQLSKYVSDLEFSVEFLVDVPNLPNGDLTVTSKSVRNLFFNIYYDINNDENNTNLKKLAVEPNGSKLVDFGKSGDKYLFKFNVYYTESELVSEVLNKASEENVTVNLEGIENFYVSATYNIDYNVSTELVIKKDNITTETKDGYTYAYILYYNERGKAVPDGFLSLPGLQDSLKSRTIISSSIKLRYNNGREPDTMWIKNNTGPRTCANDAYIVTESIDPNYGSLCLKFKNDDKFSGTNNFIKKFFIDDKNINDAILDLEYSYYLTKDTTHDLKSGELKLSKLKIDVEKGDGPQPENLGADPVSGSNNVYYFDLASKKESYNNVEAILKNATTEFVSFKYKTSTTVTIKSSNEVKEVNRVIDGNTYTYSIEGWWRGSIETKAYFRVQGGMIYFAYDGDNQAASDAFRDFITGPYAFTIYKSTGDLNVYKPIDTEYSYEDKDEDGIIIKHRLVEKTINDVKFSVAAKLEIDYTSDSNFRDPTVNGKKVTLKSDILQTQANFNYRITAMKIYIDDVPVNVTGLNSTDRYTTCKVGNYEVYIEWDAKYNYSLYFTQYIIDLDFKDELTFIAETTTSTSTSSGFSTTFTHLQGESLKSTKDYVVNALLQTSDTSKKINADTDQVLVTSQKFNDDVGYQIISYSINNGSRSYTAYRLTNAEKYVPPVQKAIPDGASDEEKQAIELENLAAVGSFNQLAHESYLVKEDNNYYLVYRSTRIENDGTRTIIYNHIQVKTNGFIIEERYYSKNLKEMPIIAFEINGNVADIIYVQYAFKDDVSLNFRKEAVITTKSDEYMSSKLSSVNATTNTSFWRQETNLENVNREVRSNAAVIVTYKNFTTSMRTINYTNEIMSGSTSLFDYTINIDNLGKIMQIKTYKSNNQNRDKEVIDITGSYVMTETRKQAGKSMSVGEGNVVTIKQGNNTLYVLKPESDSADNKYYRDGNDVRYEARDGGFYKVDDGTCIYYKDTEGDKIVTNTRPTEYLTQFTDAAGIVHTYANLGGGTYTHTYTDRNGITHEYRSYILNGETLYKHTFADSEYTVKLVGSGESKTEIVVDSVNVESSQTLEFSANGSKMFDYIEVKNQKISETRKPYSITWKETAVGTKRDGTFNYAFTGTRDDFESQISGMFNDRLAMVFDVRSFTNVNGKFTLNYADAAVKQIAGYKIKYKDLAKVKTSEAGNMEKAGLVYYSDAEDYRYGVYKSYNADNSINTNIQSIYNFPLKLFYGNPKYTDYNIPANINVYKVANVLESSGNDRVNDNDFVKIQQRNEFVGQVKLDATNSYNKLGFGINKYQTVFGLNFAVVGVQPTKSQWNNYSSHKLGAVNQNYAILTRNIFMTNSIANTNVQLYGDGYLITEYASLSEKRPAVRIDSVSVGGDTYYGGIYNTRFALVLEAHQLNETTEQANNDRVAIAINGFRSDNKNVKDIKLFGCLMNVDYYYNLTVSIISSDYALDNEAARSITSYISLVGRDADLTPLGSEFDWNEVKVLLRDVNQNIFPLHANSYSIIVSGRASNGINGKDASMLSESGLNGGTGGNGGRIAYMVTKGLSIFGANGAGGNGGNAAHGANATAYFVAAGGGAGGNRGNDGIRNTELSNDSNGTLLHQPTNRNLLDKNSKYKVESNIRLPGSGGTGGLGFVSLKGIGADNPSRDGTFGSDGYGEESLYMTAAGGGASGGEEGTMQVSGDDGKKIKTSPDKEQTDAGFVPINNGNYDENPGYYWNKHIDGGDKDSFAIYNERIFGNLQMIPVFGYHCYHWNEGGICDNIEQTNERITWLKEYRSPKQPETDNHWDGVEFHMIMQITMMMTGDTFFALAWPAMGIPVIGPGIAAVFFTAAAAANAESLVEMRIKYSELDKYKEYRKYYGYLQYDHWTLNTRVEGKENNKNQDSDGYKQRLELFFNDGEYFNDKVALNDNQVYKNEKYIDTWEKFFVGGQGALGCKLEQTAHTITVNGDSVKIKRGSTELAAGSYYYKKVTPYIKVNGMYYYLAQDDHGKYVTIKDVQYYLNNEGKVVYDGNTYNVYDTYYKENDVIYRFDNDDYIRKGDKKYTKEELGNKLIKATVTINGNTYDVYGAQDNTSQTVNVPTNYKIIKSREDKSIKYLVRDVVNKTDTKYNYDNSILNNNYAHLIGGTTYTKDIYGYFSGYNGGLSEFMSRDDMVTRAGQYAKASRIVVTRNASGSITKEQVSELEKI